MARAILIFFRLAAGLFGLWATTPARAEAPGGAGARDPMLPPSAAADPLGRALERAAARLPAGGLVAAEVKDGVVRYLLAGRPAPSAGIPPERLVFEIGSITKVFTGLLLAQAVVEHRVALEDPIGRYLPVSVVMDPAVRAITLEQLATHTAGLPRMPDNLHPAGSLDPFAHYTADDLYAFLHEYRPKSPPPWPADYSNLGAGLLGHIVELVYHEPYARLLEDKIAGPLRLADTVTELNDEQRSRFAAPHVGRLGAGPLSRPNFLAGAGGLYSTAADLVRFSEVMMLGFDHPLREAWELTRQPRHDFPAMNGKIGLGVLLMQRGGATVYWHGGTTAGTRSHLEWSPQDRHVLVVLMNSDSIEAMNEVVSLYQLKPATASGPVR